MGAKQSRYEEYRGQEPFVTAPAEFALASMRSTLEELRGGADDPVASVLGQVVDWSWSKSPRFLHRLEPFYDERLGIRGSGSGHEQRGRAPGPNYKEYGRDKHGRVVLAWLSGVDGYAEVWDSPALGVVLQAAPLQPGARIDAPGTRRRVVVGVRRAHWSAEQMMASAEYDLGDAGARHRVYEYRYALGGVCEIRCVTRVTRGDERWEDPALELWLVERVARRRAIVRPTWVVAAELSTLTDVEVNDLAQVVAEGLTERVPELITQVGVSGVVYFLMLSWTRGFNLQICPATERTRSQLRSRRPYMPFDAYLHYNDSGINCGLVDWGMGSLARSGERLELELLRRRDHGRREEIHFKVARRLNEFDWTGRMQTSDDFVVGTLSETGSRKARVRQFRASIDPPSFERIATRENLLAKALSVQRADERHIEPHEGLAVLREAFAIAAAKDLAQDEAAVGGRRAWEAFFAFVAIPVAGLDPRNDEDAILVEQSSTADGGFTLSLVRQLVKRGRDGEPAGHDVFYVNLKFARHADQPEVIETARWASPADPDVRTIRADLPALAYVLGHDRVPLTIEIGHTMI
ncbi:MAG: hypothetical protein QOH12_234 [Solirubrobacteraceae bacterium]|jgi:hypothetical protein|nr:hypothetical protein [Solirubrobacteraceae bacterium]